MKVNFKISTLRGIFLCLTRNKDGLCPRTVFRHDDNPIIEKDGSHLLDTDFVKNYFNERRDPAVLKIFSLDDYKVDGIFLKDIIQRKPMS